MGTLTIAVCARNAPDIIRTCLESIQAQTCQPDEVIVAVDSLDDPTAAAAKEFGARVIASDSRGLYEARNAVLRACTTDYLAFTDADCVLVPEWAERAHSVLDSNPKIAAGTGPHPPVGPRNAAGWIHHMWFLVETIPASGPTDGVIGGNSYFRVEALREVDGWLALPGHSAAEDVYVSKALVRAGYTIWFDAHAAARHQYETRLRGLWRKAVMMGKDIVVMHRAAGFYDSLWWYTLAIPCLALMVLAGIVVVPVNATAGIALVLMPPATTLLYLTARFRSLSKAFPRWITRWALIWPYSWGIVKGLLTPLPREMRRAQSVGERSEVAGLE